MLAGRCSKSSSGSGLNLIYLLKSLKSFFNWINMVLRLILKLLTQSLIDINQLPIMICKLISVLKLSRYWRMEINNGARHLCLT